MKLNTIFSGNHFITIQRFFFNPCILTYLHVVHIEYIVRLIHWMIGNCDACKRWQYHCYYEVSGTCYILQMIKWFHKHTCKNVWKNSSPIFYWFHCMFTLKLPKQSNSTGIKSSLLSYYHIMSVIKSFQASLFNM